MPGTMRVELVSPEKVLFSGDAVVVVCRPEVATLPSCRVTPRSWGCSASAP